MLDTNVVSEMTRDRPNASVADFLDREAEFWLAALVIHELQFGLYRTPRGRRRDQLEADLRGLLARFASRTLP
ncbi:MAG: PIN domain-containing protein, partial [Chloroflexi bacterium]|nr:PIN domain-containing protein [Chloroflexota bacterium]